MTAAGAALRVPLPFTPVPMTMQTLFVLLAGVTLGPRLGTASMALYLLLGTTGFHVFADTERYGLQTVFGPTGGYLLGFLLAQPLLGVYASRASHVWGLAPAILAGTAVIYLCGLLGLVLSLGVGWSVALALGLYPFLASEALKAVLAAGLGSVLCRWVRRMGMRTATEREVVESKLDSANDLVVTSRPRASVRLAGRSLSGTPPRKNPLIPPPVRLSWGGLLYRSAKLDRKGQRDTRAGVIQW